jgi:hypothetical protein
MKGALGTASVVVKRNNPFPCNLNVLSLIYCEGFLCQKPPFAVSCFFLP